MAAINTSSNSGEKYSYENQISEAKREIEKRFRELIERLRERERNLLNKLDEMLNIFNREGNKHKQIVAELKLKLKSVQDSAKPESPTKVNQDIIIKQIESEREVFTSQFAYKRIYINFDRSLLCVADNMGRLVVTDCRAGEEVGYRGRKTPVMSVGGKRSDEKGLFDDPYGVAVADQTGNIYVSDFNNNRVQVFDSNRKYLDKFVEKMDHPASIKIHLNRVYVSQYWSHCVLVYDLNGTFVKQIGRRGSGESQFRYPHGIAISETNGDIHVCDRDNNRIQIFSKDFVFKSLYGQQSLKSPCDIKLTNECIYVLSDLHPFLHSFSYHFAPIENSFLNSISIHLKSPRGFCIDEYGHFILADYDLNAVVIFNQEGELVHMITDSVQKPRGVALDSSGRIIIVGYHHRLLIF